MQSSPAMNSSFWRRVTIKGTILFLIFNFFYAAVLPYLPFDQLSLYNRLFPGRLRLPYGDNPSQSYNLTIDNLDAMFASHVLSASSKPNDEFRVILIGDSSTWGYLLSPSETLSAHLNALNLSTPDGKRITFYNLGYPVMSLTKDLLLLSRAMTYKPDLILWLVTLESFPKDKQLYPPLLQHNPQEVNALLQKTNLSPLLPTTSEPFNAFLQCTFIAQRNQLAGIIRLQLYGFMWSATGIDQAIPASVPPRQEDLSDDLSFHSLHPPALQADDLSFDVISAAIRLAQPAPVILINEPMFISSGQNSQIRYNFYYPRWAYDHYRQHFAAFCNKMSLTCWDIWNLIPPDEFTNTAIHMTPNGTKQTAQWIGVTLTNWLQFNP